MEGGGGEEWQIPCNQELMQTKFKFKHRSKMYMYQTYLCLQLPGTVADAEREWYHRPSLCTHCI